MTPQAEAAYLIKEIQDTRTAYDNATVDKWRAQHLSTIGLRLSALIRAARKAIDTGLASSRTTQDSDLCDNLEARAGQYLNTAARVSAMLEHEWPRDIQQEIDTQTDELIAAADVMLSELGAVVARYPAL